MNKTPRFSDGSSGRLWLAIAFISSTESCVIGYNSALYKRVGLWLSASQSAKYRLEFSSWCCERSNHTGVIVSNIYKQYYSAIFFLLEAAFKIHLAQKSEGALWMGMTPLLISVSLFWGTQKQIFTLSGHSVLLLCGHVVLYQHKCDLFI